MLIEAFSSCSVQIAALSAPVGAGWAGAGSVWALAACSRPHRPALPVTATASHFIGVIPPVRPLKGHLVAPRCGRAAQAPDLQRQPCNLRPYLTTRAEAIDDAPLSEPRGIASGIEGNSQGDRRWPSAPPTGCRPQANKTNKKFLLLFSKRSAALAFFGKTRNLRPLPRGLKEAAGLVHAAAKNTRRKQTSAGAAVVFRRCQYNPLHRSAPGDPPAKDSLMPGDLNCPHDELYHPVAPLRERRASVEPRRERTRTPGHTATPCRGHVMGSGPGRPISAPGVGGAGAGAGGTAAQHCQPPGSHQPRQHQLLRRLRPHHRRLDMAAVFPFRGSDARQRRPRERQPAVQGHEHPGVRRADADQLRQRLAAVRR